MTDSYETNLNETNAHEADLPKNPRLELAPAREDAVRLIQAAFDWTAAAKKFGKPKVPVQAERQLQDAVNEARDAGIGWEQIGDSLGIARGNAYHRYRRRPA